MTPFVAVLGTHGWDQKQPERQWWHPASPWSAFMRAHGFDHATPDEPFIWSGDLDGALFASGNDWEAGGVWLARHLRRLPYEHRNVVAHSHGGQLAALAALSVPMRSLVMIGTPVRKEIERHVWPVAVANVGACLQVIDEQRDWIATLGGLFDGNVSFRREFSVPGIRVRKLSKVGHSGLLCEASRFPLWSSAGLHATLRGEHVSALSA